MTELRVEEYDTEDRPGKPPHLCQRIMLGTQAIAFLARNFMTPHVKAYCDLELSRLNARRIVATANSYIKHCGPRATECAEDDLLGKLIEACKAASKSPHHPNCQGKGSSIHCTCHVGTCLAALKAKQP